MSLSFLKNPYIVLGGLALLLYLSREKKQEEAPPSGGGFPSGGGGGISVSTFGPSNVTAAEQQTPQQEGVVEIGPAVQNTIDPHLLRINNMTEAQYRLSEAKAELQRLGADAQVFRDIKAVEKAANSRPESEPLKVLDIFNAEGVNNRATGAYADKNVKSIVPVRGGGYNVTYKDGRVLYAANPSGFTLR